MAINYLQRNHFPNHKHYLKEKCKQISVDLEARQRLKISERRVKRSLNPHQIVPWANYEKTNIQIVPLLKIQQLNARKLSPFTWRWLLF